MIARIERLQLLPLRPVDELVKDLTKQKTSKSVLPEELIFPGLPLLVNGKLKIVAKPTSSGGDATEYGIEVGADSIKAVIDPDLAGRLGYCEDRTVKVMGFAKEDSQHGSAVRTGT